MDFLGLTFPFFALVGIGWLAARWGWLPASAVPGLNRFVLFFALPCMLFRWAAQTPLAQFLNPQILAVWVLGSLCLVGLALALPLAMAQRREVDWNNASFGALVAAFPNSGFIGMPLLVSLLGPGAAGPTLVAISVDMVFTSSLCIALSRQAGLKALRGVLSNPLPWAIAAGCAVATLGVRLPQPLLQPIALLADAASPTALFTLGALLAQKQDSPKLPPARWDIPLVVALKLGAHPLVIFGLCEGVGVSAFTQMSLTLLAALPSASNVTFLAERYGANAERIARIVLWSTVFGFASLTGLSHWLIRPA